MKKMCFSIFFLSFIISCVSMPQQLSFILPLEAYEELGQGQCNACSFLLFGVIPIAWKNLPMRAYHCAVQSRGGDDLINPTIQGFWYYVVAGTIYCTTVSGTVIKETR